MHISFSTICRADLYLGLKVLSQDVLKAEIF